VVIERRAPARVAVESRPVVNYVYGTKDAEIDEFFRTKRPWSRVKDEIVAKYIACYLKTVQWRNRPIIIVDAFAGPGRFGDGSDGSPLIFMNAITKAPLHRVGMSGLFADIRPAHRAALEGHLAQFISDGVVERPLKDCSTALARALEVGENKTIFFYLDPCGIKDLDFEMVRHVYARESKQSTEVLINFNFRAFMRMSGNWDYGDTADEVARKVKESKIETVNKVMGGDYWFAIVTDPSFDRFEREDAIVRAYMDRVRKFFQFVVSIPVKDQSEQPGVPEDDLAKYHLIFGTRSAKAVVYMNDVAYAALMPYFNKFTEGLLFDLRPERYVASSRDTIKAEIVRCVGARHLDRQAIYEAMVPGHFMQYQTKHYRALIDELVFDEARLFRDPKTVKQEKRLSPEALLSTTPWPGGEGA
jgi:three-Cys-motif partner protein